MHQLSQIDFKLLLCLNSLLNQQNVSRAADEMNMSQPAMSRALNRLREIFDDPLFVRTASGMEPTARATSLAQPLQRTLDQLNALMISEEFSPIHCNRNFRLHMNSYGSQAHLPKIAEAFYQQAPNAQLEVINIQERSLFQPHSQAIDLALCSQSMQIPDYFHQRPVGEDLMRCFMSKNHPLAQQELTLDNYMDYPHILVTLGGGPNVPMDNLLAELGRVRKIGLRTPHYLSALEVTGKTEMLFNSTPFVAQRFIKQFDLISKSLPFELPAHQYILSWPPTLHKDLGHQWLRKLCAQVVSGQLNSEKI